MRFYWGNMSDRHTCNIVSVSWMMKAQVMPLAWADLERLRAFEDVVTMHVYFITTLKMLGTSLLQNVFWQWACPSSLEGGIKSVLFLTPLLKETHIWNTLGTDYQLFSWKNSPVSAMLHFSNYFDISWCFKYWRHTAPRSFNLPKL